MKTLKAYISFSWKVKKGYYKLCSSDNTESFSTGTSDHVHSVLQVASISNFLSHSQQNTEYS